MTFIVEYSYTLSSKSETLVRPKHSQDDLFGTILMGLLLPLICIFGILSNILNGIVLSRKEMRTPVNFLFFGLAISDGAFLLAQLFNFGFYNFARLFQLWEIYRFHYDPILTPYMSFACVTGQTGTIYFTLAITADRFIAVYYPLSARRICSWKRAAIISMILVLLSLAAGLPYAFGLKGYPVLDSDIHWFVGNKTGIEYHFQVYAYGYSTFGTSEIFQHYIRWGQTVFHSIIPFIVLCVLNFFIASKIRRSNKIRVQMTSSEQSEASATKILLVIVLVFALCYFPSVICSILNFMLSRLDSLQDPMVVLFRVRDKLWSVQELTVSISSASNFLIYAVMSQRFRASFLDLLGNKKTGFKSNRTGTPRSTTKVRMTERII